MKATAESNWIEIGHYYRPIPLFNGNVLKYAGIACPMNVGFMMKEPGIVMLPNYKGDRIHAATHEMF